MMILLITRGQKLEGRPPRSLQHSSQMDLLLLSLVLGCIYCSSERKNNVPRSDAKRGHIETPRASWLISPSQSSHEHVPIQWDNQDFYLWMNNIRAQPNVLHLDSVSRSNAPSPIDLHALTSSTQMLRTASHTQNSKNNSNEKGDGCFALPSLRNH